MICGDSQRLTVVEDTRLAVKSHRFVFSLRALVILIPAHHGLRALDEQGHVAGLVFHISPAIDLAQALCLRVLGVARVHRDMKHGDARREDQVVLIRLRVRRPDGLCARVEVVALSLFLRNGDLAAEEDRLDIFILQCVAELVGGRDNRFRLCRISLLRQRRRGQQACQQRRAQQTGQPSFPLLHSGFLLVSRPWQRPE